jgi:multidrug efflux system outer membrane protein
VLEALSDVEVALTRLSRGEERRLQTETAAERQRQILHLTTRQQEVGEVSRLNVLEARRLTLLQEDQTLRTQAQSLKAFISLCKALGGGWNA